MTREPIEPRRDIERRLRRLALLEELEQQRATTERWIRQQGERDVLEFDRSG